MKFPTQNIDDLSRYPGVFFKGLGDDGAIFIKNLKPNFFIIWRDILLGYFAIILMIYIGRHLNFSGVTGAIQFFFITIYFGFWINYLTLFIHEASHHNLAKGNLNDFLSATVTWLALSEIGQYRESHFKHHRHLGTMEDPENSYFNELTPTYLFKVVSGIYVLKILLARYAATTCNRSTKFGVVFHFPILLMLATHLFAASLIYIVGGLPVLLSWIIGLCLIFPFFSALRQILEHRPLDVSGSNDIAAVTRMFGEDFFSKLFGAAGFNQHLLHHWAPSVSYTRFSDMKKYLQSTKYNNLIAVRRSSYADVFRSLLLHSERVK